VEKTAEGSTFFELQGIISSSLVKVVDGKTVCDEKSFAVFTNVSPNKQWIQEKTKEENNCVELHCDFRRK